MVKCRYSWCWVCITTLTVVWSRQRYIWAYNKAPDCLPHGRWIVQHGATTPFGSMDRSNGIGSSHGSSRRDVKYRVATARCRIDPDYSPRIGHCVFRDLARYGLMHALRVSMQDWNVSRWILSVLRSSYVWELSICGPAWYLFSLQVKGWWSF